jgi:hypothetical protein
LSPEAPDDTLTDQVEDRLEDLFGDEETAAASPDTAQVATDHPLRELKSNILSIEWEITDEVMTKFVEQLSVLQDTFQNDKIVLVFLQLLGSIGEYIRINLGKSHPDAFKILNSLFGNLEKIVLSDDLAESEKKKILAGELQKYKKLKSQLATAKPHIGEKTSPAVDQKDTSVSAKGSDFDAALKEIKELIQAEFKRLREEIESLKKALAGGQ